MIIPLSRENNYILQELQRLQQIYLGSIDINIETRYDQKLTGFNFCAYKYNDEIDSFISTSKLYCHKFYWINTIEENEIELSKVKEELAKLYNTYAIEYSNKKN